MNAIILHDDLLLDASRWQREAILDRMPGDMFDADEFTAMLLDGTVVIASYHSTQLGLRGEHLYEVEGRKVPESSFKGMIRTRPSRRVTVPLVPEAAWCGTREKPTASERYDMICEEMGAAPQLGSTEIERGWR